MEYNVTWRNQGGVTASGMTKWILALYNSGGTLVKSVEDSTPSNLNNFTDVVIKIPLTYQEAITQTTTNTLKIYFDRVSASTLLGEKTILFNVNELGERFDSAKKTNIKYNIKCSSNDPLGSGGTYRYVNTSGDEIKLLPGVGGYTLNTKDCSEYTYTGVKANVSTDGRCGKATGKICPGTQCCSRYGWCGGTKGNYSGNCSVREDIDGTYHIYKGGDSEYDGVDIKNIDIKKTSFQNVINSQVSTNGICGKATGKICPGNQCCTKYNRCGGTKPNSGSYCSTYDYMKRVYRSRGNYYYKYYYKGGQSDYDGQGFQYSDTKETTTTEKAKDTMVFTCARNDPLNNNNTTLYRWDPSTESIKNVSTAPAGYGTHTLPNCAGIKYGGVG